MMCKFSSTSHVSALVLILFFNYFCFCVFFFLQEFDKNDNYDRCDTMENLRLRGCPQELVEIAPNSKEIKQVGGFLTKVCCTIGLVMTLHLFSAMFTPGVFTICIKLIAWTPLYKGTCKHSCDINTEEGCY